MKTNTRNRWRVVLVAGLAVCASTSHALVLGVTEGVTYRATDNQIEARFAPIAELLAKALKQPVKVKVLPTYANLREALKGQQVDVAFIHPAHVALEAVKTGQWQALAWTAGYTEYKVNLLCKQPKAIDDWKAVSGKALVTPDPDSITAVMTRAMLREHGVEASALKITTTRFQDAVPFYVENGFAAYGATASRSVVKTWTAAGGKSCAESRPVPIKQWLASSKLDPATLASLREALLALNQTDAGKAALATSTYSGFVAPSPDAEKALITWLGL